MYGMTVVFWDVQHGHATYVQTPNGRHIVVDLGTGCINSGAEFSPLQHLREKYKIDRLDYVIVTHPHVDHIDDVFRFSELSPRVLTRPTHLDKNPILAQASTTDRPKLEEYFKIGEQYCHAIAAPDDLKNPDNWGGLNIKSFVPATCSQTNLNNHSVVTTFNYAGIKVLVPGDNEPPSWKELMKAKGFAEATENVDIMLASHHGRESGFDAVAMKHFNPRLIVVSDGPYGDTSATSRYSTLARGWQVYKRSGGSETRRCVTTRRDGVIAVTLGPDAGGGNFLHIKID